MPAAHGLQAVPAPFMASYPALQEHVRSALVEHPDFSTVVAESQARHAWQAATPADVLKKPLLHGLQVVPATLIWWKPALQRHVRSAAGTQAVASSADVESQALHVWQLAEPTAALYFPAPHALQKAAIAVAAPLPSWGWHRPPLDCEWVQPLLLASECIAEQQLPLQPCHDVHLQP